MGVKHVAIFIHGVGYFTKGRLPADSKTLTKKLVNYKAVDFCWSELVAHPFTWDAVQMGYLKELGKAMQNAAWLGFDVQDGDPLFKKFFLLLSNIAASIVYFLSLAMPILLYFYFGASVMDGYFQDVDPVWGYAITEPPFFLSIGAIFFGPHYLLGAYSMLLDGCLLVGAIAAITSILFAQVVFGLGIGLRNSVRRLIIILTWPLIFASVALGTYTKRTLLGIMVLIVAPMFAQFSQVPVFLNNDYSAAYRILIIPLLILALVGLLKLIGNRFGVQLRLLGDIFFYLGNEEYRNNLVNKLDAFVSKQVSSTSQKILLLSHSLGSVIAADYLLKNNSIHENEIHLTTMGSPLKRFFFNFFPTIVPSPEQRARALYQKYNKFKWQNIYRPLDFIGGKLASSNFKLIKNFSTGQIRDPLSSHMGYWRDKKVADIISRLHVLQIDQTGFNAEPAMLSTYGKRQWKTRWIGYVAAAILLFGFPVWNNIVVVHYFEPKYDRQVIAARYADLEENGKEVVAKVSPFKTIDKSRDNGITSYHPNYKILLTFETLEGDTAKIRFVSKKWIDMEKLSGEFKNSRIIDDTYYREVIRYDEFNTPLVYHPENHKKFMLTEYTTISPVSDGLYPVMEFLSPFLSPLLSGAVILLVFGNLITCFAGLASIAVVEEVEDFVEDIFD